MHIWAGKVLWRVEQVEFRTSSSVSPVIYLVRLATSANNSRMQLSMHYLHSNIFNWAGQPAKRRQNWAGKLHSYGFLAYLFSTLQINLHPSNPREWELDTCPASKQRYYHTLTYIFVFKKKLWMLFWIFTTLWQPKCTCFYIELKNLAHHRTSTGQLLTWSPELPTFATCTTHISAQFTMRWFPSTYLLVEQGPFIYFNAMHKWQLCKKRCLCTMGQSKILD